MDVFEFLEKYTDKQCLQYLAKCFELKTSGTKEEILNRIKQSGKRGLNFVLLRSFDKYQLSELCRKLDLRVSGTKEDLENRLYDYIVIPGEFCSDHDSWEIDHNGVLHLITFDKEYFLERYFNKEDLAELCSSFDLHRSGSKRDLIERLLSNSELSISDILHEIDSDHYPYICDDFGIDPDEYNEDELVEVILTEIEALQSSKPQKLKKFKYDVAISFAGEDRKIAEEIKTALTKVGVSVFYDLDQESELWGKDLYEYLSYIYSEAAKFCILLISRNYAEKKWTNHERKNAQARAFREKEEYILPIKLDSTIIPGIPETIAYLDYDQNSPERITKAIQEKLRILSPGNSG